MKNHLILPYVSIFIGDFTHEIDGFIADSMWIFPSQNGRWICPVPGRSPAARPKAVAAWLVALIGNGWNKGHLKNSQMIFKWIYIYIYGYILILGITHPFWISYTHMIDMI